MSTDNELTCTICDGPFNIETEGGVLGDIGILPVAFCPTCIAGILDFADQYNRISTEQVQVVLEAGIEATQKVLANWSSGDLANAVNQLEDWATQAADYLPEQ